MRAKFGIFRDKDGGYDGKPWYVGSPDLTNIEMIWDDGKVHIGGRDLITRETRGWFKTREEARRAYRKYRLTNAR